MPDDSLAQATLEAIHRRLDQLEARMAGVERSGSLLRRIGWLKVLLSAVTAGIIGGVTPILTVMAVVEPPVPILTWYIGAAAGALMLAKDLRSQLDLPPVVPEAAAAPKKGA